MAFTVVLQALALLAVTADLRGCFLERELLVLAVVALAGLGAAEAEFEAVAILFEAIRFGAVAGFGAVRGFGDVEFPGFFSNDLEIGRRVDLGGLGTILEFFHDSRFGGSLGSLVDELERRVLGSLQKLVEDVGSGWDRSLDNFEFCEIILFLKRSLGGDKAEPMRHQKVLCRGIQAVLHLIKWPNILINHYSCYFDPNNSPLCSNSLPFIIPLFYWRIIILFRIYRVLHFNRF